MRLREALHEELARAFGTHAADPLVEKLAGLRRIGAAVFDLEEEIKAAEAAGKGDLGRARCYFAGVDALVTFADSFVLDAFADPEHPRHLPRVTFVQAQAFYLRVPELVTAVRQEMAYPGSATAALPILPGPRYEPKRNCPIEHLLAMQRAAKKMEEVVGTRIEALKLRSQGDPPGLRAAVLRLTAAHTAMQAADQILGALRSGQHVSQDVHEQAERFYYDGALRNYLYGAQELELPGITKGAPDTEDSEEPDEASGPDRDWNPGVRSVPRDRDYEDRGARTNRGMGLGGGFGGGMGGGMGFGTLIAADVVGNLVGDLLGGLFGGGMGGGMGGGWW